MKRVLDRAIEFVARARAPKEPPMPAGTMVEGDETLERPLCPLCGNTRARPVVEAQDTWMRSDGRKFSVVRCEICAHRYTTPRYKLEHREKAFEGAYPFYRRARSASSMDAQAWAAAQAPFLGRAQHLCEARPRPGRLLDVGCGDGVFCDVMRTRGWEVSGIDMESDVVAHAREHLKVDARMVDIETEPLPEGPFEAVSMWGVIQLIYRPQALLERVRERLSENGVLAIGVSNVRSWGATAFGSRWYGLGVPRHLSHFTPDTLRRLVEFSGYEVERVVFDTPRWILAGSVDAAIPKGAVVRKALKAAAYTASPLLGRTQMADTLEIYARPKS